MSKYALKAEVRTTTGKEKAKKLRTTGVFPAVVYGAEQDPVSLTLSIRDVEGVLAKIHGEQVLVDLEYAGKTDKVFVRNVQRDPVVDKLLHVDFYRVDLTREMVTSVPIHAVGTAAGVKLGGILEYVVREITIRCLPTAVPPHLEVNVESLDLGQSLHVSDLPAIPGIRFVTPGSTVLIAVAHKSKEEETPAAAAAAAAPAAAPAGGKAAAAPAAGKAAPAAAGKAPAKPAGK